MLNKHRDIWAMSENQQVITEWFNTTYRTKAFKYLRSQAAYEIFGTILSPQPDSKHLDVACGPGLLLKAMHNKGVEVYGVDISAEAIRMAQAYCPQAHTSVANAERLPFEDNHFDSVSCIGSLERMINRKAALKEQIRVTKDDGKICLMVRNSEHFIWKYLINPLGLANRKGHQDAMNLAEWKELILSCNCRIEAIYPDHWPYIRMMQTIQPWKRMDASRIRKFPFNLELAYEFIFVLNKS